MIVDTQKVTLSNEHIEYKWYNIDEAIKLLTWNQQKKGLPNRRQTTKTKLENDGQRHQNESRNGIKNRFWRLNFRFV